MSERLALVTGGAGLIGSHLTDLLLKEGWRVRILDSLEPQTHAEGAPDWIPEKVEPVWADIRDTEVVKAALAGVDTVFHLAAYGGYMPEIAKFVEVNSLGTARLLETIRDCRLSVRKLVVASSQAVYVEGAVCCPQHGLQFPARRNPSRLATGHFKVDCPTCAGPTQPDLTPEHAPTGGETVYALTKLDQERLVLNWSHQCGIPAVALRFSCTYGPRQSIFNPYTGVIAIFCTRLLNGMAPVIYEDGRQTRDLCYAGDVARACLLAAESDRLDGLAVNIGTGRPTSIAELARTLADLIGSRREPEFPGDYRPGEMRALTPNTSLATEAGFRAEVPLEAGLARYLDWIRARGRIQERFAASKDILRERGMVRTVQSAHAD